MAVTSAGENRFMLHVHIYKVNLSPLLEPLIDLISSKLRNDGLSDIRLIYNNDQNDHCVFSMSNHGCLARCSQYGTNLRIWYYHFRNRASDIKSYDLCDPDSVECVCQDISYFMVQQSTCSV